MEIKSTLKSRLSGVVPVVYRDIKQYFDWGEVGDHILARALEMRNTL